MEDQLFCLIALGSAETKKGRGGKGGAKKGVEFTSEEVKVWSFVYRLIVFCYIVILRWTFWSMSILLLRLWKR